MRLTPSLAGMLLFAGCAAAQPGPGPDQPPPPQEQGPPPGASMQPGRHGGGFEAANVTHDGRLTREQAQAGGMNHVAQHFEQIDADRKGYVTKQDIRTWRQAMKAARQARMQQQGGGGPPGAYPPAGAPPAPESGPPMEQNQPGPPPQ